MVNKKSGQRPEVPSERFNIKAHYHPNLDRPGSLNSKGGYFIDDPYKFDPSLFGISPVEATWMDPQHRKLLEVVYEALESGGISLESIAGTNTGVYVGTFTADFQQMTFHEPDFRHGYAATGVDQGILSNRINYIFDLKGPR
jgi:acyl transferase domain-containing protein